MKKKMIKLVLIFTILSSVFTVPVVFAQESSLLGQAPPVTSPTGVVTSAGAPFNVGWNYFRVSASECTLKNVFNELQAAGGGALLAGEIWKADNGGWKMFGISDLNNVKVNSDNVFAFNSNQKFYLNIAPDACKTKNTNRDLQIEQVRDASTEQKEDSFLEKLLSVPGDFWSGILGKMEVNKQEDALTSPKYSAETAVFTTLNVLERTVLNDLGITGSISSGLLVINGIDPSTGSGSSINTLSGDLYLQDRGLGGINILNGKILIDKDGNLKAQNSLAAKSIEVESIKITKATGKAVLPANTVTLIIETPASTETSKILLTPRTLTDKTLTVTDVANGKFTVGIKTPDSLDITFFWFIIQ